MGVFHQPPDKKKPWALSAHGFGLRILILNPWADLSSKNKKRSFARTE